MLHLKQFQGLLKELNNFFSWLRVEFQLCHGCGQLIGGRVDRNMDDEREGMRREEGE